MVLVLLAVVNACNVSWDPVLVLPAEARAQIANSRIMSPCRVSSLPAPVRNHLAEAVGNKKLVMAEPDQEWNDSCLASDRLPSRQLIAAATGGAPWLVHYRQGGFAPQDLAVVLEINHKQIRELWRGWCRDELPRVGSPEALLGVVKHTCSTSVP